MTRRGHRRATSAGCRNAPKRSPIQERHFCMPRSLRALGGTVLKPLRRSPNSLPIGRSIGVLLQDECASAVPDEDHAGGSAVSAQNSTLLPSVRSSLSPPVACTKHAGGLPGIGSDVADRCKKAFCCLAFIGRMDKLDQRWRRPDENIGHSQPPVHRLMHSSPRPRLAPVAGFEEDYTGNHEYASAQDQSLRTAHEP
jgi:hypothetical protein